MKFYLSVDPTKDSDGIDVEEGAWKKGGLASI